MQMTIVNLTPHAIALQGADGEITTIPPSGQVARVATTTAMTGYTVAGLPVQITAAGAVTGLPAPANGTVYLVSGMVLAALAGTGRCDVVAPATGPNDGAIRNDQGHIVAVTRLNGVAP
jgi:hypothetical protein